MSRQAVRGERGAAAIFLLMFSVVMFAAAGLVVDGGLAINARMSAADDAEQASRAGAGAIDLAQLRSTGEVVLAGDQARQQAVEFLQARGYGAGQYSVTVLDGQRVQVVVRDVVDTALLSLVGIERFRVEGEAVSVPCTDVAECG